MVILQVSAPAETILEQPRAARQAFTAPASVRRRRILTHLEGGTVEVRDDSLAAAEGHDAFLTMQLFDHDRDLLFS